MDTLDEVDVIFVPGYGNSSGTHWQCEWFARMPHTLWAEQSQWNAPELGDWLTGLQNCVARSTRPILFVSHSLGGLVVAAWAERYRADVAGAFLVVPPDTTHRAFPRSIAGFHNPTARLWFPSMLVATLDDPYAEFDFSVRAASVLGAELVVAGRHKHINPASGFGPWPDGERMLRMFAERVASRDGRSGTRAAL